jgi:nitrous oxidase accessory protein NosD
VYHNAIIKLNNYTSSDMEIAGNIIYNDSTFNAGTKMTAGIVLPTLSTAKVHHNTVKNATTGLNGSVATLSLAHIDHNIFSNNTTSISLTNHAVDTIKGNVFDNCTTALSLPTQGTYWFTEFSGNTFRTVTTPVGGAAAATTFRGITNGVSRIIFASAAPTQGTWAVGDVTYNVGAAVGQPKGWMCTAAGTPGTWTSMGNL